MFSCSCLFIKCTIFILLLSFDIETCNSSKPHCFEVTHTEQFTPFLNNGALQHRPRLDEE